MFRVLILICTLCASADCASITRLADQLNSVRKEMAYMNEDITSLSLNVEKINRTLWSHRPNDEENTGLGEKMKRMKPFGDGSNPMFTRQIAHLLQAFESEKLFNRQLQNQNEQLYDRVKATENKMRDFNTALETEKEVNRGFQNQFKDLKGLVKANDDKNADLNRAIETGKRLNQQCISRLQVLEDENSDMDLMNKKLNGRIRLLEKSNRDTLKVLESEKNIKSQIMTRLKVLEDDVAEFQNKLGKTEVRLSDIYNEVVENMTSLMEHKDTLSRETTTYISRTSTVLDPDDEEREIITTTPVILTSCRGVPYSGVYGVFLNFLEKTRSAYCDADTDGGDWVVTMRRQDGSVDFDRNWNEYKNGFGNVDGEFWIGNDILHELTKSGPRELRVDMEDFNGTKVFAKYEQFQIGSEADKYTLSVSGYSGTAGDSLSTGSYSERVHDGMKFSTRDSDNDRSRRNCASTFKTGWWFNMCFDVCLTCPYSHTGAFDYKHGVFWLTFTGYSKSLKYVEMKLR